MNFIMKGNVLDKNSSFGIARTTVAEILDIFKSISGKHLTITSCISKEQIVKAKMHCAVFETLPGTRTNPFWRDLIKVV